MLNKTLLKRKNKTSKVVFTKRVFLDIALTFLAKRYIKVKIYAIVIIALQLRKFFIK